MNTRKMFVDGYVCEFIQEEGSDVWFAACPDLPGCMTEGDGFNDAYALLVNAMELWRSAADDCGVAYPQPVVPAAYVGVVYVTTGMGRLSEIREFASGNAAEIAQAVYWAYKNARNADFAVSAEVLWHLYWAARDQGDKSFAALVKHAGFDPRPVPADFEGDSDAVADWYIASDHGIDAIARRFHDIVNQA